MKSLQSSDEIASDEIRKADGGFDFIGQCPISS